MKHLFICSAFILCFWTFSGHSSDQQIPKLNNSQEKYSAAKQKNNYAAVDQSILSDLNLLETDRNNNQGLPKLDDTYGGTSSPRQEKEYAEAWIKLFRSQVSTAVDPPMQEYLEHSAGTLARYATLPDHTLHLIIIPNDQLNAFALTGGLLAVNLGLFTHAQTPDEFASILAHEIAHLQQRHYARNTVKINETKPKVWAGILAGILLMSLGGSDGSLNNVGSATIAGTVLGSWQSMLTYSRMFESEADREGIKILRKAGYNPYAAVTIMERLSSSDTKIPIYFLSHPYNQDRRAELKDRANSKNFNRPVPRIKDDIFPLVRMRAVIFTAYRPKEKIKELESQAKQIEIFTQKNHIIYGLALAYLGVSDIKNARKHITTLLKHDTGNIYYQLLDISLHIAEKKYEQALKIVEEALSLYINNYPLLSAKGEVLWHMKKYNMAELVYKKLTRMRPKDPHVWLQLSDTQSKRGNIIGYHEAYAEHLFLMGGIDQAINHMKLAKLLAEKNKNDILYSKYNTRMKEMIHYRRQFTILLH